MISIDYKGHPKKSFRELICQYSKACLILDDVLADEESYSYVYQDILDILKYGLEYKEIREMPISFVIHANDSRDVDHLHHLQVRHFLSNMVMWYAFMKMEKVDIMDESFIIDWVGQDIKIVPRYLNEKVLPYNEGDYHSTNAIVDEIVFHIKAISDAFCLIFGYSASIWDIIQAEKNDPEIHDIIYTPIDPTMQPKEMEETLESLNKKLMDHFGNSDSDLRPLIKSGKNISAKQFREIFLRLGFKADISNRTIPYFIDNNLLITGIDNPAAAFINGAGGRGSLMNTKLSMSKPGALSKKMNNSATSVLLRKDHEHCDSTRPLYYTIEDEDFLKLLDKRWYYDEKGNMKLLDYRKDTHLIGKRVGFRSPCTCASHDGICELCYGTLFDMNSDLFSQGSLAATKLSEPVGQLILSNKHVNTTSSDEIDFPKNFNQYCDLSSTEITLNDDVDNDLMIKLGPVQVEETDDGDVYYVEYFDMVDFNGEVKDRIQEEHGFYMYLAPEMVLAWKQMKDKPIPVARFDDEDDATVLFNIEVKSKAITQSLQLMTAILDSKDHLGYTHDVDSLCQAYARVLIDAGIMYNLVHAEMIIRSLMRKKDNELEYPDFGPNGDHENYTILRLTNSLSRNPSPLVRLSTGWLKKSLLGSTLYKADHPSHLDAFFVPILSDIIDQE